MGWPFGGDNDKKSSDAPAPSSLESGSRSSSQQPAPPSLAKAPPAAASSTSTSSSKQQEPQATPAAAAESILAMQPRPTSVFEFGQTIQAGQNFMRGVCTGDNPDAIQACTWSIEPLQAKPKEKKHVYRVEF